MNSRFCTLIYALIEQLKEEYPLATIHGHNIERNGGSADYSI